MNNRALLAIALVLAAVALGTAGAAASAPIQVNEAAARFPFRSYVLTAPHGVRLSSRNVQVTENGQQVSGLVVSSAATAKAGGFGVVLAIDASDSMTGRPIAAAAAAARAFAQRRPATEALGVITFNGAVRVPLSLTTSKTRITSALSRKPKLAYGTHVYSAVVRALAMIHRAKLTSGTIVLLTDGADTGSRFSRAQAIAAARAAHVRIFTVGIRSGAFEPAALVALASGTGGTFSSTSSTGQLAQVYSGLGEELSHEYLLQYRSLAPPGRDVNVRISVAGSGTAGVRYKTPPLPEASAGPYRPSWVTRVWSSALSMVAFALVCALLLGVGLWALLRPAPRNLQRRVSEFVTLYTPGEAPKRAVPGPTAGGVERAARQSGSWQRFTADLEIADIAFSPSQILLGTSVATVAAVLLCAALFGSAIFGVFGLLVPVLAYNLISGRLAKRRRLFSEQLPDTLQVIASALRAGHTLIGALAVVAAEAPEPTRSEMRRVVADEQFGIPLDEAIDRVARRMASTEFEQVAVVAALQREAGGNVAEVLDRVAHAVRQRIELRQLVRSLTAQGRLSRWLLTALPPGLAAIIAVIDPGYLSPLFHKTSGQAVLILAGIMVVIGSLAIKKIVEIEI